MQAKRKPNAGFLAIKEALANRHLYSAALFVTCTPDVPSWNWGEATARLKLTMRRAIRNASDTSETYVEIPGLPALIRGGYTDEAERDSYSYKLGEDKRGLYRPHHGYWSLFAYTDRLRAIIDGLPDDATVRFEVGLDAGNTGNIVTAGLHADHLMVRATWERGSKEHRREFLLDYSVGPHNSARFGVR